MREEGLALAEVAVLAHVEVQERSVSCDKVPELAVELMGAAAGKLVDGDDWRLLRVSERCSGSGP